ncbi:MAG: hypothetical protein M1813_009236 [Trichoglossum hirsutum]|nr:MAG: hypothetical protein M1813_009236 [Trichoglossum hirsutum]
MPGSVSKRKLEESDRQNLQRIRHLPVRPELYPLRLDHAVMGIRPARVIGSTPFDINKDGQMFVLAFLGCLWMSEEELSFDPTILEDNDRCTHIWRNGHTELPRFEGFMKRQRSVAGRATTCWRGSLRDKSNRGLAIKVPWEYKERPEEGLFLKEATEAGVKNVTRYYHHETVRTGSEVDDVPDEVRKGLSDIVGRKPFQQRWAAHSEANTSPITSSASGPGRVGSRSRSRTMTRRRSSSGVRAPMPPTQQCNDEEIAFTVGSSCGTLERVFMKRVLHAVS